MSISSIWMNPARWARHGGRCALLAGALCGVLTGCSRPDASQVAVPPVQRWTLPVAVVVAGTPDQYSASGSVRSEARVVLSSRVGGQVRAVAVNEGDAVKRGQLLVQLDAAEVSGAIRQAQAAQASAQATWQQARTEFERYQRLFERGSISDNEWRRAQLRRDAAREAQAQAQAGLDTARAQREQTELRSPIDGVVIQRHHRVGDLAMPGQPLLTLESLQGLVFETFVPEGRLAGIVVGQAVTLQIDGMAEPLTGRVSHVVPVSDERSRSHQVKITVPAGRLAPGQFGRALFNLGERSMPSVPRSALVERGGLQGVFVVDAQGQARFRWLRLGTEWAAPDGGRVAVVAGLQAGERVVLQPGARLREGDLIVAPNPS